jgi:Mrp family chromosome partitioning ATPase
MAQHRSELGKVKRLRERSGTVHGSPRPASEPVLASARDLPSGNQTKVRGLDSRVLRANRIVAPFPGNQNSDVFRMLRTQILQRMRQRNARTLGICSARENEGKSLVALNLAISISQIEGHSVLLVELDLRRPSLLKILELSVDKGIDDVLAGDATVAECLINPSYDPGYEGLFILPTRKPRLFSSEIMSSPKMASLTSELRSRHPDRFVLYDLPPMLFGDDCLAITSRLDACLFVVEEGKTRKSELQRALSLIDKDTLVGTVLNKASKGSHRYYGYY